MLGEAFPAPNPAVDELHHRVANVFHLVGSLLHAQAACAPDDRSAAALRAADAQIRAFALLLDEQRGRPGSDAVCAARYIRRLAQHLRVACLDPRNITLELALPASLEMEERPCRALGLIVVECVMNAVKHAFPDRAVGRIGILLSGHGDDARLAVIDDGVGLAEPTGGGRGLSFVRLLAESCGGLASFENCGGGTRIGVALPTLDRHRAPTLRTADIVIAS